jgi:hypothetical protein
MGKVSIKVYDRQGRDVTYDDDWHLNMEGELLCATNDIDEPYLPVNPAEGYRYEVIHHIC